MDLDYKPITEKHGVSISAIQHLAEAIAIGHGKQAQFNHPELGGMGQWMPNMLMIGDMFNHQLKAKVDVICHELAQAYREGHIQAVSSMKPMQMSQWWSEKYINPSFVGGQTICGMLILQTNIASSFKKPITRQCMIPIQIN